ncbi:molybdopterin-guanine dinucleotide biosynthesis protein MobB [Bordetella pertussis]|uniref:Molybdopterin-guanine dinucleotide biosynthesis protein B n=10 Tax=Pseudomonadota TaxID=1224 RepID=Q7VY90_BORPE|nr:MULTISPECIES: molybdopterin-guanine dinucleotide biosynthesis protein B [Bordetella]ETH39637.1 molybdopterin-guanine dinucleotide biosynthesis protein B [Bordetella pertussis H918]ETH43602.1 molybdopterin-guanine dinucleotide biosynthesis protein B [Bordetella pertussis H939]ETH46181.1 molybdopterin-guanine dinucleotide biosynthesis protein B [Bordetella pertussis H921]ETH69449.1 molybdopterin-guanine dinucleotide biosynthesis protein B [Bordetella pertussis STO1-CHLA-0011]ETH85050.1 molybd
MTRIIGFAGWSGAGKTQLLSRLIPCLKARGHSVSTLKHAHHTFDIDTPGKDSFRHREAGATEVLIASSARWALMHELRDEPEPELGELLARMCPVDFILVEGFKRNAHIKIEVHRHANGKPWLFPDDPSIGAIACDAAPPHGTLPRVALDDYDAVADLVERLAWPLDTTIARLAAPVSPA